MSDEGHPNLAVETMETEDNDSGLASLGKALRALQDAATATSAPMSVASDVAQAIDDATSLLLPFVADAEQYGADFPNYVRARAAHTLMPQMTVVARTSESVEFAVLFGIFYRNPFGQVHGGAIAMVFDTAIARLGLVGTKRFLTANLSVDYRGAAPVDVELTVRIRLARIEGRKRFIEGELMNGDELLAEVRALFIEARD